MVPQTSGTLDRSAIVPYNVLTFKWPIALSLHLIIARSNRYECFGMFISVSDKQIISDSYCMFIHVRVLYANRPFIEQQRIE